MKNTLIAHLAGDDAYTTHSVSSEQVEIFVQKDYGQTYFAAVQFGIVVLLIVGLWVWISRLPKPQQHLSKSKELLLEQCTAVCVVTATSIIAWDLWWHRAVGRDSFWEAPHVFVYGFIFIALYTSVYGWYCTRKSLWKKLVFILLIIPISAPFDQLWHTIFGVEDLTRPHLLVWALPHLLVAISAILVQLCLLPILQKDPHRDSRELLGMLIFGNLTATSFYLMLPFHPTDFFGQLLGFWGAGLLAMVIIVGPLVAREWLQDRFGGLKTMFVVVCILLTSYGKETAEGIVMIPHDRMPNWVLVFTIIITGVWVDLSDRVPMWLRGLFGGVLSATIMFGSARYFLMPEFYYGDDKVFIAIVSGAVGGLVASFIAQKLIEKIHTPTGMRQMFKKISKYAILAK